MRYPFFVYGTLKRGEPNYARYLAGRTIAEEPAQLAGAALYTAGPYPFLVREDDLIDAKTSVQGSLISIRDSDYSATLTDLDSLEGYVEGGLSNLYERTVVQVETAGGRRMAWVYVAGVETLGEIRAGRLRHIASGLWRA